MSMAHISPSTLEFLKELKENNHRDWFEGNKKRFKAEELAVKKFFNGVLEKMRTHDDIDHLKMFRIYRDVRFSNDKTPYKSHLSGSFHRTKPRFRGGYYLHIEPKESFLACGFWDPNKDDLFRMRKEFEMDDKPIRKILNDPQFKEAFGALEGEELKTAPKGFDKEHPAIDLIRKKHFVVTRKFTDKEVMTPGFDDLVNDTFKKIRPYFNYMSEVLTTDMNGVSLID